ncbi:MAG: Hsp20/alpha crystallin family protein [Planctomycetes bacterium]|nr:Hsp20/alpha crystallin family protein [Planctomycetota bacterium]
MNRHLGQLFGNVGPVSAALPAFNVWSNDDGSVITTEVPGVKMEDIEITAAGDKITVKGSRKAEEVENSRLVRRERSTGYFSRTIKLPYQIDSAKVEAKLANGVLRITLPRAESDKPRKIAISAS